MKYFLAIYRPLLISIIMFLLAKEVHSIFFIGYLIMLMDIWARFGDFLRIKDRPYSIACSIRLKGSWCSRGVAMAAWPESHDDYRVFGYRWYHILPDGFPFCFTRLSFWQTVLGFKSQIRGN
jgi:hypothetical protein